MGFLAALILMCSVNSFAQGITKTVNVVFNKVNVKVNGMTVKVDNILYNGTTYAPVKAVAEMLGKEIKWDGSTSTVYINDRAVPVPEPTPVPGPSPTPVVNKTNQLHVFYAIKSYDQFSSFISDGTISVVNTISFGWSRMEYDITTNNVFLNLSNNSNNDFHIPQSFNEPIEYARDHNIPSQLNVYADRNLKEILNNKEASIKQIVDAVNKTDINGKTIFFNGAVIDFEGLQEIERDSYTAFLKDLKKELVKYEKKLFVTVPPRKWQRGYDYKSIGEIADKIILMAHDYDTKLLNSSYAFKDIIYTPLTPIKDIREALEDITNPETGIKDPDKVFLQINFGSTQWKTTKGILYDSDSNKGDGIIYPGRPTYETIYNRIKQELSNGNTLDNIIHYDETSKNPYIIYYNQTDSTENIIWYEDSRSVIEKINLAKEFSIGGISIWRLGNIPAYGSPEDKDLHLDVWQEILKQLTIDN